MKNWSLSILVIHFLLLASIPCTYAQPKHLHFTYLTPDDGLSSSIASCIIQDHKGLVWIGTPDGLNRYDGFNFVIYRNNHADSTSLADNIVKTLFEDHNKNLLIGTENGLCLYDSERDRFRNYVLENSSPLKGIICSVLRIAEDSIGNLWLATSVGLIYFDRSKNKIIQFTHDPDNPESLSNNNVEAVLIDKNGNLWVTTRKGLNLYLPETGTFKHFTRSDNNAKDLSNTIFINIIEDLEGNLWFGSTEGLYCLKNKPEAKINNLVHYQHDDQDKSSLSINQITSLFVDDTGNLWIGTENGGINLFNVENQNFWHYRKDDYDPQSLNNESIEAIYQDKSGNLWFGTYTGGLNIVMKNSDAIIKYQNLPGAPLSLSHNTVMCFSEDRKGRIWVGTDGGGLNLFNMQINRFSRFNMDNSRISSNSVLSILEDSNNQLWLGTWAGGLVHFDIKTRLFTSFTTKNSGIQDDNIYAIAEGDNNDLWLGSFEHGLIHYQIRENKFTEYTPGNSGLINEMVIKIVKYSKGRLLIGSTMCLQIFSPDDGHFITYLSDPNNVNGLSYPRITDILVENDSCIWVGTPEGLNLFNPNTGTFKRYYEKDGLPNNFIKGLILDKSGALWVTTNQGICRFDYKNGVFKNFTKADGFQSNEFSDRSILKLKSGALLMGGTKGFNLVYPERISGNKIIPEVLITDLKIFNKSVGPGTVNSPLSRSISETKSLTLSHNLSVLTFYFAVMDFTAPKKNQYAYMMENFDKEWIYAGNKGEATYTNLNPGKYVFRVKGTNNDGLWNETGTSIQIIILPPWWGTWWFRLTGFSVIILIFVSVFLFRVRNLKNQKIRLEKLVAIKTTELQEKNDILIKQAEELNISNTLLEDRQVQIEKQREELLVQHESLLEMNNELHDLNASKDKFFSIIAHDLKNPFNSIIGFSDMLKEMIESDDHAKSEAYAGLINISAVQTLRLLENLLEWANSQTGKILFNPVPVKLSELFNEEFCMLNDMATGKNIELKCSLPDDLTIIADKNMIKTIFRNLISNAIKFTHKNGKVEVKAVIDKNNNVEISVSDSGIGMTEETKAKLFRIDADLSTRGTENEKGTGLGLFLCKEFVEKHGGKIWVESESGKGSIFKFLLPSDISHSV